MFTRSHFSFVSCQKKESLIYVFAATAVAEASIISWKENVISRVFIFNRVFCLGEIDFTACKNIFRYKWQV